MTPRAAILPRKPRSESRPNRHPLRLRRADGSLEFLATLILGAAILVVGIIAWWARSRGLDLTDEGIYLLSLDRPAASELGFTQFHRVVDLLLGPLELGVPDYRFLRFIVEAAPAAFLGYALHRFVHARSPALRAHLPSRLVTIGMVTIVQLMSYSWLPQSLSYNTLNAAFLNLELGLSLLLLSPTSRHWHRRWVRSAAIGIGALLALHLFVKWSTPLVFVPIFIVLGWACVGRREGFRLTLWVAFGGTLTLLLISEEFLGSATSLGSLRSGVAADTAHQHSLPKLVELYVRTGRAAVERALLESPLRVASLAAIFLAPVIASRLRRRRVRLSVAWGISLLALMPLALEAQRLAHSSDGYFARGRNHEFMVSVMGAAALVALAVSAWRGVRNMSARDGHTVDRPQQAREHSLPLLMALLLILPFLASAGTLNSLVQHATVNAAGLGGVFIVGLSCLRAQSDNEVEGSPLMIVPIALVSVIIASQAFHGMITDPYRLPTNLYAQSVPVEGIPNLEGVNVDPATHDFVTNLYESTRGSGLMAAGDFVLALSHMPGTVFIVGGTAPGTVIINHPSDDRQEVDCVFLERAREDVRQTKIVLRNSPLTDDMTRCLEEAWPGWSSEVVEVARFANPYQTSPIYNDELRVLRNR